MNLFLSRKNHDKLLDTKLLSELFGNYTRRWDLGGVTFFNVPQETIDRVSSELSM